MATSTTKTNKPINPRGNDQSPKGYNRAALYSGKALDFDGVNDLVTMPTALTSSLSTTSVTFVTNVKTDFATWAGTRDDAFSFAERGMILAFNGGNIYYYYRHQSSGWRNLQVPNADFKPQEWNQMVTTIDLNTNTWKAYVNGVEVATSGTYSDTAIAYDANALTIGGQAGARFFDGQIAGFKIFNTALTAAQVSDLYNNPEKIVPTGVEDTALKLWLPMMEGAGTTAYDGSGNGNHGTISGATYVNGVGAPVAQTAVMDWNKKENLIIRSEAIVENQVPGGWAQSSGDPLESSSEADPTGRNTASLINVAGQSTSEYFYNYQTPVISGEKYTFSIWTKLGTANNAVFVVNDMSGWNTVPGANYVATAANGYDEWKQVSITFTAPSTNKVNVHIGYHQETGVAAQDDGTFYLWGAALHKGSTPILVPTNGTAQPTPVLLPQGLTTGRDITGVNLFENVRKQGALNLDGNSWAEVHDNESLDFGTGSFTLEAWAKAKYTSSGSVYNAILTLGGDVVAPNNCGIVIDSSLKPYIIYNTNASVGPIQNEGDWFHIVGSYDGTKATLYVNGSQVDQDTITAGTITNADTKMIGKGASTNRIYSDQIAQPRIYNRALTAEEVQRSYDSGKNIYTNS